MDSSAEFRSLMDDIEGIYDNDVDFPEEETQTEDPMQVLKEIVSGLKDMADNFPTMSEEEQSEALEVLKVIRDSLSQSDADDEELPEF